MGDKADSKYQAMTAEMVRACVAIDRLVSFIGEKATREFLDGFMGDRRTWAQDDKEKQNADE